MDTQALAYAFCAWPLPATVCADLCATDRTYAFPRAGTNLLTVAEAKAMFDHLVSVGLLADTDTPARLATGAAPVGEGVDYIGAPREIWPGEPSISFSNWWCYNAPNGDLENIACAVWMNALRFGHITEQEQQDFERDYPVSTLARGSKSFGRLGLRARLAATPSPARSDRTGSEGWEGVPATLQEVILDLFRAWELAVELPEEVEFALARLECVVGPDARLAAAPTPAPEGVALQRAVVSMEMARRHIPFRGPVHDILTRAIERARLSQPKEVSGALCEICRNPMCDDAGANDERGMIAHAACCADTAAPEGVDLYDMDGLTLAQRLDKEETEFSEAVANAYDEDFPGVMPGDVEGMFHRIRDAAGLNTEHAAARLAQPISIPAGTDVEALRVAAAKVVNHPVVREALQGPARHDKIDYVQINVGRLRALRTALDCASGGEGDK